MRGNNMYSKDGLHSLKKIDVIGKLKLCISLIKYAPVYCKQLQFQRICNAVGLFKISKLNFERLPTKKRVIFCKLKL